MTFGRSAAPFLPAVIALSGKIIKIHASYAVVTSMIFDFFLLIKLQILWSVLSCVVRPNLPVAPGNFSSFNVPNYDIIIVRKYEEKKPI